MFGLRPVERAAADRLRVAGYRVVSPDLFAGAVATGHRAAPVMKDGFALMEQTGWDTITARALDAVRDLPPDTVLCGFSMGVGVVGTLWPGRLDAAGAILLHATTQVPEGIHPGTPVQAHVADQDPFAPPEALAAFRDSAVHARADVSLHTYPGAGHFYTDPSLPDHDPVAADRTWQHVRSLLDKTRRRREE
jgi:dienelactone hydrolase